MARKKNTVPVPSTVDREATKAEGRAMVNAMRRVQDREERPTVAIGDDGINSPHTDRFGWHAQLVDTFGTRSSDFSDTCVNWLVNAVNATGKPVSQTNVNAALAVVAAAAPSNEVEALLAIQLFATHDLSMEMMRRAKQAEGLNAMSEYGALATKLSRTMTAQVEALGKLRRGGEQTVRVEHVHVYDGGQAVVGVVNQGGVHGKQAERVHGPDIATTLGPALLGQDPARNGMPVSGGIGEEEMPHPRRRRRERRPAGQS